MQLWSVPGDVVLSPFMGIGSETYMAVKMDRKAIGAELKPSYFNLAKRNMQSAKDNQYSLAI
jgi:DNA modification methylase